MKPDELMSLLKLGLVQTLQSCKADIIALAGRDTVEDTSPYCDTIDAIDATISRLQDVPKDDHPVLVCPDCGSDNVQSLHWVNLKTGEHEPVSPEEQDNWCEDCQKKTRLIFKNQFTAPG